MTQSEAALFDYLIAYNSIYRRIPSIKQIAFDLKLERTVISKCMQSLARQGKVTRISDPVIYKMRD